MGDRDDIQKVTGIIGITCVDSFDLDMYQGRR